ncbi:MAG: protein translocase subunit SecF [Deltaproteobacteria bacterium]|nr:MAG: protein translocase subunit SecF [Deltaproteobacteria bacterium]
MQFIKSDINLDFIGKRKIAFAVSLALITVSFLTLLVHKGPKYGVDFAGGSLIQVQFDQPVTIASVKAGLNNLGVDDPTVQTFGADGDNEYLIRTASLVADDLSSDDAADPSNFTASLKTQLSQSTGQTAEIRRVEMVGPQVGKDLREKALLAMFYALLFITIYISGRFELKWLISAVIALILIAVLMGARKFFALFGVDETMVFLIPIALIASLILFWILKLQYAMGAIVALVHDVFITVGVFSLFNIEFSLPIIAAILTIIGYSLNDTIIVFDRIRENMKKMQKKSLSAIINRSINETLSRTILTSITTLLVVVTLLILGGSIIFDFALALFIGILIGTYSSIFVASPILLAWQGRQTPAAADPA